MQSRMWIQAAYEKKEKIVDVSVCHHVCSPGPSAINRLEQIAPVSAAATSLSQVTALDQS